MFVEHQSTSGTKICTSKICTIALVPNFSAIVFTERIVKKRDKKGKITDILIR